MFSVIFPGQGSQSVGMTKELYDKYDYIKELFKSADDTLGYSISKIILEGPKENLDLTENTQPAIFLASYSIFEMIKKESNLNLNKAKYFAGHSLGEYSALVCSDALNFSDALYLLFERGKAMQEAVPIGKGSMIAVLGLKNQEIKDLIKKKNFEKGVCEIANDNADGQVILSGDKDSIHSLQSLFKEKKIKSIPLKVSAPFHCSLMQPAAKTMNEKIINTKFEKPIYKIVNNVTAKSESDIETIKKLLVDQIFSTVRWRESLTYMSEAGVKNFIEIGPGKALIGMVKRTVKNVNCFSINSIADIKNLINELKK